MANSTVENKTVRPGSFIGYSYYRSSRNPAAIPKAGSVAKPRRTRRALLLLAVVLAGAALIYAAEFRAGSAPSVAAGQAARHSAPAAAVPFNACSANTTSQMVIVSISKRHLWVCQSSKQLFDSAVVTGNTTHPDTITPIGTYKVYAKASDTTLTGSDSTGTWSDPVSYWMPFLDNQYGAYGFHDATWRADSAFGNTDPSSPQASHGCVELPLATAKWLYNWVQVGTSVTIES